MNHSVPRHLARPGLVLLMILLPSLASAAAADIAYEGKMLTRTIHVDKLRTLIGSVDGLAEHRAEEATGLPLDRDRVRLVLEDVPVGMTTQYVTAMSTEGHDTTTVRIRAQVWLRSAAYDSAAACRLLTHEYVHAILRQQVSPEDHAKLPTWFTEGLALHLAEQTIERLHVVLVKNWVEPRGLYTGLASGRAKDDPLAGAWWFEALTTLRGPEAIRTLLGSLVESGNLYDALSAFECTIEDLWRMAEENGKKTFDAVIHDTHLQFVASMTRYMLDSERGLTELKSFIDEYPDTYAGYLACYHAAKLSLEQQRIADARDFLSRLDRSPYDFGMGDPIMYLRILIEFDCGNTALTRRLCEDYFGLWPDGYFYEQLQLIYNAF